MSEAEVTRFVCPRCDKKFRAQLGPQVKSVRCPNGLCGKMIPVPARRGGQGAADKDAPVTKTPAPREDEGFAWSALQGGEPAPRPKRSPAANEADAEEEKSNKLPLVLAAAAGVVVLVVAVGAVAGVLMLRRAKGPEMAAVKNEPPPPAPARDVPPPEAPPRPIEPAPMPPTVEVVRVEPEKLSAGDDVRVWLRGRPGSPRFQYRTGDGDWQEAAGDVVHLRGVKAGDVTLHLRAVDRAENVSAVVERKWTVAKSERPPTVEIARLSPEKPRPGGKLTAHLKGHSPGGDALTFQYRTSREGQWAEAGDAVSLPDVKEGELLLEVRARDAKGQFSQPATRTWTVPPVAVTNEPARRYKGHRTCAHGVAFTPDGRKFLSGSCDRTLKMWDSSDADALQEFKGVKGAIFALDVSPDGRYAVTGGIDFTGKVSTLQLWDLETAKEVRSLSGHTKGRVLAVKFSPDGATVASGGDDGTVRLWDVKSGEQIRTFEGFGSSVMAVTFSGDGKRLLGAGGRSSEDDTKAGGTVRQWDGASGKELTLLGVSPKRVTSVAFLSDDRRVIASGGRVFASEKSAVDPHVRVWDLEAKKEVERFVGNDQGVTSLALTFDKKYVFCASGDATMRLREVTGGGEVHRFAGHKKKVLCMAISRNSHYVVTGSEDGQLLLWDLPREVHIAQK